MTTIDHCGTYTRYMHSDFYAITQSFRFFRWFRDRTVRQQLEDLRTTINQSILYRRTVPLHEFRLMIPKNLEDLCLHFRPGGVAAYMYGILSYSKRERLVTIKAGCYLGECVEETLTDITLPADADRIPGVLEDLFSRVYPPLGEGDAFITTKD